MRTRFIKPSALLVAIVLTAGLASCGNDTSSEVLEGTAAQIYSGECASKSGDKVTIYSGRSENLIKPVLDAFACETGHDVAVRWGDSTDLALLLGEEGSRSDADVFLSQSPGPISFLEGKDLLAPIDDSIVGLVGEGFSSSGNTWVGFSGRKRVAVYNIDEVSDAELPASIFDLTDDRWRGEVGIPATNGSFVDWFTVFRDQYGTDVATDWINDMADNGARYYPNNRSIVEAASRGEIKIGLVNHYYNYQEAAAAGDNHRALNHDLDDDDIGSMLIVTAATIPAATDDRDGGEALLAYLLSEPVQRYFTEETLEYPLAAGVEAADALPPLNAVDIGSINFDTLGGGFEETNAIIEASGILNQ